MIDAETVRVVAERVGSRGPTRIARSRAGPVLAAAGVDARPVLRGGITEWQRRGGHTVEFRRCGSA
jgi:hypothetical protein